MKALKLKMGYRSKKDESEERDEPIVSEDELDHEVGDSQLDFSYIPDIVI